jgi:hypothetical protein
MPVRQIEIEPDSQVLEELTTRRDEGLRNASSALSAGDWEEAAEWEERAIISADAIALLSDARDITRSIAR